MIKIRQEKYTDFCTFQTKQNSVVINNMDIKDIRRDNLRILIEEFGSAKKLSDATDTNPNYISQVLNMHTTPEGKKRGMGSILARRLEEKANKELGWMDTSHMDISESEEEALKVTEELMFEAVAFIKRNLNDEDFKQLTGKQLAKKIFKILDLFRDPNIKLLTDKTILKLIK